MGGRNTSFRDPANKLNFFSQVVLDVDCYDFKTGTWSTLPAKLPLGTGGGSLVALDNKLYYLGGERATATENNAPRKNTFFLNLALPGSQWQETDSLKQARNGVAAAVLNGKIYVAGGAGGDPGGPPTPGGPMPGGTPPPAPGNAPPTGAPTPSDKAHDRPSGPGGPGMPGSGGSIAVEVFTIK